MRTFYEGHDQIYQQRRDSDKVGWDGDESAYVERRRILKSILDGEHAPKSGRLLELGCGAGNMTLWLETLGFDTVGIDIAPTAIEWARSKAEKTGAKAQFFCGSVLELSEFESESFDFILDGKCLHCIIGADRTHLFQAVARVLKPGGYFLVDTMSTPVKAEMIQGYDPETRLAIHGDIATRYFGTPESIEAEATDAGFEILARSSHNIESNGNLVLECRKPE